MKFRFAIAGSLVAISCVCLGLALLVEPVDELEVASDPLGFVDTPSDESAPESEDSEEASDIVLAGYQTSNDEPVGPASISVRIQRVEFADLPEIGTFLDQFWMDVPIPEARQGKGTRLAMSQVISSKELDSTLASPISRGLAFVHPGIDKNLTAGRRSRWTDTAQWTVTPTITSDNGVGLLLSAGCWHGASKDQQVCVWNAETQTELHPGDTLVVDGQDWTGLTTNVTCTPILSDIPLVGDFFTTRTVCKESHKTLYLVTVEAAAPPESSSQPQ